MTGSSSNERGAPDATPVQPASPPRLCDIGVNLTDRSFASDAAEVIARAHAAGVQRMVITGTTENESRAAAAFAGRDPASLRCTAGVHPHYAKAFGPSTAATLRELAASPVVAAIGECGLDYFRDLSPRDVQQARFAEQLQIAQETGLPAFVHDRDAHADLLAILREHRHGLRGVVVHCFTGSAAELDAYLALDAHIGITGWICDERRGLHLRDLVRRIPADRLMIETDAPYLLPRTIRPKPKSRRNEPAYLPEVLRVVAEARGEDLAVTADATTATAAAFFGWDRETSR